MFGEKLAELRRDKKLSQYELAEKLGFSRGKLANYEQGTREPDFETLELIADYFNVSIDYLLGRCDSPSLKKVNKDEEEFQAFANDPSLQKWYKELPNTKEEDLRMLRKMWEILKDNKEV